MDQHVDEKETLSLSGKAAEILININGLDGHQNQASELTSTLFAGEMDALTAIADTLLPSVDVPPCKQDYVRKFYATSASMTGTPNIVGGYISEKLHHPMLLPLRLTLWLLSTWYGTLAICGLKSMSWQFPYFRRFADVEPHRREEILLALSQSSFFLYRMFFKAIKFLVVFFHFTQVDEEKQNPTWEAIGYCGSDPTLTQSPTPKTKGPTKKPISAHYPGPLHPSTSPRTIHCDAVVVGSGSGGGVVAGVLAKAGYKVVVLEKGPYLSRSDLSLLEGDALANLYEGSGLLTTSDVGVVILAGSGVGGGSSINWSASLKTPPHVLSEWVTSHELELFGSEAYEKAMDVVCERMGVRCGVRKENMNNAVLRKGCSELGYPVKDIPRNVGEEEHYCGWCCFGCRNGVKKGTAETWLVDLVESGNGVVFSGCEVDRVVTRRRGRNKVAKGVEFVSAGERFVVHAKVTVVAGGALNTPVLLKKSGLKNRNIGRNLHLHPVVMVWGTFPDSPSSPDTTQTSYEGGIMSAMSTVVANTKTTGYGAIIQTPSLHPGMFSVLTPWMSSSDFRHRMSCFSRTAHIFALARDQGSGTVNGHSSYTYNIAPEDEKSLQSGVEKMLRIMAAAGAEEIGTQSCMGDRLDVKKASSHEFERFVKETGRKPLRDLGTPVCSAHQMGSCRMGVDEATSVVNQRGETWEVDDLFLADTSVFPTALGVNPMVTVQAIAYCTAQSVLEVLHRSKKWSA